ncbi:MAG: response regulator, partial [Candidatus Brocadiaceae bacterium]
MQTENINNADYILVVEDSHTQARQIESILKQTGYPVRIAYNAREALSCIQEQKPVIVVSDIVMPEMDGYQFCRTIKSDERFKNIMVVLLTQLADPKEIVRGLECGADDFIVKPYNEELLFARIQAVLELKSKQDAGSKQVNILVVEDSRTQAEQLKYLLEEQGYTVSLAAHGKEGLEKARATRPTLIISDILMPVMDGYEFAYEIKHDKELKNIPIILITSLMDRKEIARKASIVADGYFTKPYDDKYLVEKIESLLNNANRRDAVVAQEGIEVTFAGERYTITAGRRQILSFLLSTYENAVQQNRDLILMQRELQLANEQLEERVLERTNQLQENEKNFRAIAENASDGIIITDAQGECVYANKQAIEMTGYTVEELGRIRMKDMAHPDTLSRVIEKFERNSGGLFPEKRCETVLVRKDQSSLPIELTVSKTTWHGLPARIIFFHDITERKKREEEIIKTSKLESLSILAGGIAHDFNNLLTGVIGNISLARMHCKPDDTMYKLLADIEKASLRTKGLTKQLLTFAKGGSPIKKTASIARVIKDSVTFATSGSHVRCNISIPEGLWPGEIDEGQISQVAYNLVINAEQAMPEGGTIFVSAENTHIGEKNNLSLKSGRYVKITIRDTGVGIPEKHLSRVFDPYFTTKNEGSGLGLATAYSIVKNHHGYIGVESKAGAGATFSIFLPASTKEMNNVENAQEKTLPGKGKVLVMDDDEFVRDVAGKMLTSLGYQVDFARNGEAAITLYKQARESRQPFEAVIMDLTISGGMGGGEAVKKLLEIDKDARAIVSSGYSDDP